MLDIQQQKFGTITVLNIAGRLDSINIPKFRAAIAAHLVDTDEAPPIILNMRDVNYLSAAGLRVLRGLHEQAGSVTIAEPGQRVREVLQITGLDQTYNLHHTQLDAIRQVKPITNAHTHLELGWLADGLPELTGEEFVSWLHRAIYQPSLKLPTNWETIVREAAAAGVQAMMAAGITTVGDITRSGLSLPALINARMKGIVYFELLGGNPNKLDEYMLEVQRKIEQWRPRLPSDLHLGLSIHAPYSVSPELWRRGLAYAKAEALPLCIHVAESQAETQYLLDMTGAFPERYSSDVMAKIEPLGLSPVKYLEVMGALDQAPLLVHGVQVDADDIALIKQYNCTMVHCPRSNLRLQCGRMPLEQYLAAEVPVLLGTDSLVSSPSLNIFEEIEIAIALHQGKVAPEQILALVHEPLPNLPKT